jgi:hypothetical protein
MDKSLFVAVLRIVNQWSEVRVLEVNPWLHILLSRSVDDPKSEGSRG